MKKIKKTRRIFLTFIVLAMGIVAAATFKGSISSITFAADKPLTGWLWGGSEDASLLGCAKSTNDFCDESGVGSIKMKGSNYGVTIPTENGTVKGYAWSTNLGWIDFEPQLHCIQDGQANDTNPAVGVCEPSAGYYCAGSCAEPGAGTRGGVSRSGNQLTGWARVVDIAKASALGNSGEWGGWIHMNGNNYGVTINDTEAKLGGYAWNGEEAWPSGTETVPSTNMGKGLGWIKFAEVSYEKLSVTLRAQPSAGQDPFTPTLIAEREPAPFSTAQGLITYTFFCKPDDFPSKPKCVITTDATQVECNTCIYTSGSIAKVIMVQGSAEDEATTEIFVDPVCNPAHCDCTAENTCEGEVCVCCSTKQAGTKKCNKDYQEVIP